MRSGVKAGISAFALAGGIGPAYAETHFTYLDCVMGPAAMVLAFDEGSQRVVDALNPSVELVETKVTAHEIKFSSDNPFHSHGLYIQWAPDASVPEAYTMSGQVNRLTGIIEVTFFARNDLETIAKCKASNDGPWCDFPAVTATKQGTCKRVVRRF